MSRRVLEVFGPVDGGVPEHVGELARGLPSRGWEVEVAGPAGASALEPLGAAGVTIHPLELARAPGMPDVRAAHRLRALDAAGGFELVHAHSSKAGALARLALPDRRRLVYTPHCFGFSAGFGAVERAAYRAVEQVLVPRTAALVAVSEWERGQARRLVGATRRTHVLPHGIRPCPDGEIDPGLAALGRSGPLVGFVGRLADQKDPLALVRAAAELRAAGRLPGPVALVGNGELAGDVEREIERLGVGDVVRRFAFTPPAARYLRALDLFVAPSRWESLPIAVLEAMSCGVPVLATRVGGVPELVEDGVAGQLVPPGDPHALSEALGGLLEDPARLRELGRAGRATAAARFDVARMVAGTAALYDDVVASRARGRAERTSSRGAADENRADAARRASAARRPPTGASSTGRR